MEIDYVRVYQESPLSTYNSLKNEDIVLFPNPVKDQLNIKISENNIGTRANIYSILGEKLATHILDGQQNIFDISHYQNGIYLVKIKTIKGIQTYKVLKN